MGSEHLSIVWSPGKTGSGSGSGNESGKRDEGVRAAEIRVCFTPVMIPDERIGHCNHCALEDCSLYANHARSLGSAEGELQS